MAERHTTIDDSRDYSHRTRGTPRPVGPLLREIGEALYGPRWQTEMSLDLGVASRSIRRWLTGETRPQPDVWRDLDQLLALRAAEQSRVRDRVRKEREEAFAAISG